MIDSIEIDYERNPIFRPSYEAGSMAGSMAERRRNAVTMLSIARPDLSEENERQVASLPDGKVDELIGVVTTLLKDRSTKASQELDEILGPKPA